MDELRKDYPLNLILDVLHINKTAYYYWKNKTNNLLEKKIALFQKILQAYHDVNGIYGAKRIAKNLVAEGTNCSTSKVSRIMRFLGIKSIVRTKFPYRKSSLTEEERAKVVNLIKGLKITRPNQVWTMDITYIKTKTHGYLYLITYIDAFSRRIVGWGLKPDQKTESILAVLKTAVKERQPAPGLIIHSDKGSQMRSKAYRDYCEGRNIVLSYTSWNHSCDENAMQESFHASLKKEAIYQRKPETIEDAYETIYNYIECFYNPKRLHSALNYLSPITFEQKNSPNCQYNYLT